jgi:hypoxanthine phosphoribosyltransferase
VPRRPDSCRIAARKDSWMCDWTGRVSMWKGLDPTTIPVFLSYDQIERMIAVLLDRAAAWQPSLVVGIMRGGVVPATMAATILAKPLALIGYERATRTVSWQGPVPVGDRVLLVDDGCSTGNTMMTVRDALVQEGRACFTMAVVHDPEGVATTPDLSHPMRVLWRFPWERGEATPNGRALRSTGAGPDVSKETPFAGIDLDGLFPPDVEALEADPFAGCDALALLASLPFFGPDRAILITGRQESERARTKSLLCRYGISMPLECRPNGVSRHPRSLAHFKAFAASRHGCTHFVESDPAQAILIASAMPHLIVTWWSMISGRACVVAAAESPEGSKRIPKRADHGRSGCEHPL